MVPACRQAGNGRHKSMYFVYIIQSELTGEFYKGLTVNINRRLDEHNSAQTVSIKNKRPFTLVHVHICESRLEAREWEKFFKSGIGREVIKELAGMVEW